MKIIMSDFSETRIQFRRGTASEWIASNPVLSSGEPGYDISNKIFKIGDGVTAWGSLSGVGGGGSGGGVELNDLTLAVVWANVPDANITQSSVIQHSGALQLTESQIVDLQSYLLNVVEDTSPQLGGNLDINSNNIVGTGNINVSGNITANSGTLDVLSFNINNESILTKGQLSWDDTEGSLDIGLTDNTTIHIGEHRYFRIRNETGSPLYKGQVVYATGVHSNGIITPAKYIADGSIREVRFMGMVLEDVSNQSNGYVIDFGHLHDIDLDGSATNYAVGDETWLAGDILYVHPTVAGKLTKVEPPHSISVAIVLDPGSGSGNGRLFVRPISYGHLDDNHDVSLSGVAHNDVLVYNSGTTLWENSNEVVFSQTAGITGASGVNNIVIMTSGAYTALGSYDPNTVYFVV